MSPVVMSRTLRKDDSALIIIIIMLHSRHKVMVGPSSEISFSPSQSFFLSFVR